MMVYDQITLFRKKKGFLNCFFHFGIDFWTGPDRIFQTDFFSGLVRFLDRTSLDQTASYLELFPMAAALGRKHEGRETRDRHIARDDAAIR